MSSTPDIELEEQLLNAGNKLLDPSSSDDELLSILDQVESCLLRVEQSPTKSMQTALSPSLRALVTDQLLEHPNADVKVSVASCISEITRITAPDAPYDDDEMKKVFQLIVSSFENLPDKSSRSYNKRVSILDTVSKVRSCVVMLDLECDALIVEMFKHFLKAIRDYHPDNVFLSMETVMALVLEESEDISPELLSPILASVKKEVLSIARKLGERVLESSASKVKPYLIRTVKSLGIHLKDYSQVVASICEQDASSAIGQSDDHATLGQAAEDSKLETSLDDAALVDKEIAKEEASPKCVDSDTEKSPKPVVSNGIAQTGEDESYLVSGSKKQEETSKKQQETSPKEEGDQHDQYKATNVLSKVELDNVTQKAECKLDQTTKQKGRKTTSSKSEEPSDGFHAASEKEEEELLDSNKSNSKDDATSLCEEPSNEAAVPPDIVNDTKLSIEAAVPSDIVKDTNPFIEAATSSGIVEDTKALESESGNVVSPPPSGGLPEEGLTRKVGRPKKKRTSTRYTTSVTGLISNKTPEGPSDPEVKKAKRSGKNPATRVPDEDRSATIVTSNNESTGASDSEVKTLKKSNKQVETSGDNGDGFSSKHQEGNKKQGHFKAVIENIEKDVSELSDKDDKEVVSSPESNRKSPKDEDQLEETPQSNSKRKRTPVVEKAPDGKDLVGAKIKVWWPKDKMYYEGVVDSYDSAKNKHKVLYIDGDEEVLNLRREKWELVTSNPISDEGEGASESSPDASSDVPLKKKLRASSDRSAKLGSSSKRGRGASSNKAKGSASRPGRKSGTDSKSKSDLLKRLDEDSASKSKLHAPKSGSKSASLSKAPNKSKDDDDDDTTESSKSMDIDITPKSAAKTKQDTVKAVSKSRGKNSKGGAKSSASGSSKIKARSTKVKETEDAEDASSESEALETVLLKSANSSKAKGSGNRSGKKRRRGGRSR